jgi:hypothetical protein
MAKAITSEKITLGSGADPIRFSFLSIEKAKAFDPKKPESAKFGATALLDPSNKAHAAAIAKIKSEADRLLKEGGIDSEELSGRCFGSGDKKKYDGWKGMFFIQASNDTRPTVVGRELNTVVPGDKEWPYSGAYGVMTVTLWLQNNSFGKKINGNLRALQFVKPGQAFGVAPVNAEEEFEAIGDKAGGSSKSSNSWDD